MDVNLLLCVLGLVLVIEGLPYFAFPNRMKIWLLQILEMPDSSLRRVGFAAMLIGLVLVYLGRRSG
jgi:uncharacterized protein